MSPRGSVRADAIAAAADPVAAAAVLGDVKQRHRQVRWARTVYRKAVVTAVEELERQGLADPYSRVAKAAGVSRQTVRVIVNRARADRPTA